MAWNQVVLGGLWLAIHFGGEQLDVAGSGLGFRDLVLLLTLQALLRRSYTAYLEWCYATFPAWRTQPKRPADSKDVTGRTQEEVEEIDWHDRMTLLSVVTLHLAAYYALPSLYPAGLDSEVPFLGKGLPPPLALLGRGLLHHYTLSFGMYWAHRNLHVQPWLWERIHSKHHYAKTPLARTTYMDHWADNFGNAVISELCTQVLVPLPPTALFVSRLFRVAESLEKHSGVSGAFNLTYTVQRWLPCAAMPHHHDWHHEGHKNSNYTFASIGGVWDVVFGTRHFGRADKGAARAATRRDRAQIAEAKRARAMGSLLDHPVRPFSLLLTTTDVCPRPRL